jgi:hypothetical protein
LHQAIQAALLGRFVVKHLQSYFDAPGAEQFGFREHHSVLSTRLAVTIVKKQDSHV